MSAFDYARPSGVWANEMVPGAGDFWRWDFTQAKAVNGDIGGTWSPSKPIILGGAGGQFAAPWLAVGGCRTQTGGRLVLGQHDVIALSPPRTRTITMALLPVTPYSLFTPNAQAQFTSPGGNLFTFGPDVYYQKAPAGPPGCGLFLANVGQPIAIPIPKSYLHTVGPNSPFDGQLAAVTLNFTVLAKPGGVLNMPTPMLQFFNSLGPADTTTQPAAVSQLRARGQFSTIGLWQPASAFTVGQYFVPESFVSMAASGSYFKVITASGPGLTGATFPAWNTTPGATTVDGNLTWTCIGGNGSIPLILGAGTSGIDPNVLYNGGAPQSLTLNLDTNYAFGQGLDTSRDYFMVGIAPPQDSTLTAPFDTVPIVYHSVQFLFTNITSLTARN